MKIRRVAFTLGAAATLLLGGVVVAGGCAGPKYVAGLRKPLPPPPPELAARLSHEEARFEGARGLKLFSEAWLPTGEPRGALVIMHGLKDHADRYAEVAQALVKEGFAVHAFDLRGHGDSEGERVWVESFDDYLSDLDGFVKTVKARHPGRPVFVMGHSMGGAIATLSVIEKKTEVAGLVLSAPALRPGKEVNGFLIWLTGVLGSATPRARVLELPEESFSRDPATLAAMKSDPLIAPGPGPARTARELLGALERIGRQMEEVEVPLLVLHGTDDRITNPEGSRELVQRARAADKTLKLYDGLYHDLAHEPERAQVIADLGAWLSARAPRPAPEEPVAVEVP